MKKSILFVIIFATIAMTVWGVEAMICSNPECLGEYEINPDIQTWQAEMSPIKLVYNDVAAGGSKVCKARSVCFPVCPHCSYALNELEDDVSSHTLQYPDSNTHYDWTSDPLTRKNNITYKWEVNTKEGN